MTGSMRTVSHRPERRPADSVANLVADVVAELGHASTASVVVSPRSARAARLISLGAAAVVACAAPACTGVIGADGPGSSAVQATLPPPSDPPLGPPRAATEPAGTTTATPLLATVPGRRLRRLSNREYNNVVRDLLGERGRPADDFLEDAYANGYDNGSTSLVVQSDQLESYQVAAEMIAERAVADRLPLLLEGCLPALKGDAACAKHFLATFPARAFRRPLTETERARLASLFELGASDGLAGGVRLVVEAVLQSPQFLYREELGAPRASLPAGYVELTPHEIASAISFLITGSVPDGELAHAAERGGLADAETRRAHAARLLATAGARDSMRALLHRWFATHRLESVTKYPWVNAAFGWDLLRSMGAELDHTFDRVLWMSNGSLRELFTSPIAFVDRALAGIYGVPEPAAAEGDLPPVTTGPRPTVLDAQVRAGILTRAGFLTAHSSYDNSGPIERGVFVLGSLLCLGLPPPPPNIPFPPAPADPSAMQTTRRRFEEHVTNDGCRGCHRMIDGVGFGFEEFDAVGVHRTTENGAPIDSTGELIGTGDVDGPFRGVTELAARMVASQRLTDCFARQIYRYAMGDMETPADPLFATLRDGLTADTRMTDLLLEVVASPNFVVRRAALVMP